MFVSFFIHKVLKNDFFSTEKRKWIFHWPAYENVTYCSIEYFKRKSYRLSKFSFFAIIGKLSVLSIRFAIRTYHAEPISLYHLTEKGLARIIWYFIKVCMQYFWLYKVSKLDSNFSFDELDWIADTSIHSCLVLHASATVCAWLCNEFSCGLVYLH